MSRLSFGCELARRNPATKRLTNELDIRLFGELRRQQLPTNKASRIRLKAVNQVGLHIGRHFSRLFCCCSSNYPLFRR